MYLPSKTKHKVIPQDKINKIADEVSSFLHSQLTASPNNHHSKEREDYSEFIVQLRFKILNEFRYSSPELEQQVLSKCQEKGVVINEKQTSVSVQPT